MLYPAQPVLTPINSSIDQLFTYIDLHRRALQMVRLDQPLTNEDQAALGSFLSYLITLNHLDDSLSYFANILTPHLNTSYSINNYDFSNLALGRTRWTHVHFSNCNFTGASIRDSYLNGIIFEDCSLHHTDLRGTDLFRTYFHYSDKYHKPDYQPLLSLPHLDYVRAWEQRFTASYGVPLHILPVSLNPTEGIYDLTYAHGCTAQEAAKAIYVINAGPHDLLAYTELVRQQPTSPVLSFNLFMQHRIAMPPEACKNRIVTRVVHAETTENGEIRYYPHRAADLSHFDLSGLDLSQVIFLNANLSYAILHQTRAENSCFMGANLSYCKAHQLYAPGARFQFANFDHSILTQSQLQSGNFDGCTMRNCNMMQTHLMYASLRYATLERANLKSAILNFSDIECCNAKHTTLDHASLQGIFAKNATFSYATGKQVNASHSYLEGCDIVYATLPKLNLSHSHLDHARLNGSRFPEADFTYCTLADASLEEADFSHATLAHSLLQRTNLMHSILNYSDLSQTLAMHANFTKASLKHAIGNSINASYAILDDANFAYAHLRHAQLWHAQARGAAFDHAELEGTNFTSAHCSGAFFTHANMSNVNLSHATFHQTDFSHTHFTNPILSRRTYLATANIRMMPGGVILKRMHDLQQWQQSTIGALITFLSGYIPTDHLILGIKRFAKWLKKPIYWASYISFTLSTSVCTLLSYGFLHTFHLFHHQTSSLVFSLEWIIVSLIGGILGSWYGAPYLRALLTKCQHSLSFAVTQLMARRKITPSSTK